MKVIKHSIVLILSIVLNLDAIKFNKSQRPPVYRALPCGKDESIESVFAKGLASGYNITIKKDLGPATSIRLTFDSQAAVILDESAKFSRDQNDLQNIFSIYLIKNSNGCTFNVRGQAVPFAPPYLTSLKINDEEFCSRPNLTYFRDFPVGVLSQPDRHCGRRKILHTELIVEGVKTKAGDWPWHAALFRNNGTTFKYICGGSLISRHFVLTAAHCATIFGIPVIPDILGVELGKYNLYEEDFSLQKRKVYRVYVHDEFSYSSSLSNDIALLKLRTEAVFNNYVQPACLWNESVYDRLPIDAYGTVVGWGFDESDTLTTTLHTANLPQISDVECILSKPEFYGNLLKDRRRFCAGYTNGTTVCNGDSGGSFVYFIPDIIGYDGIVPGAWYVKGIVSNTLSRQDQPICDPNTYAIFTDVAKYMPWIQNIMDD